MEGAGRTTTAKSLLIAIGGNSLIRGGQRGTIGSLKDKTGVERVKAGDVFPLTELGKMNWLVEGVVGQPR